MYTTVRLGFFALPLLVFAGPEMAGAATLEGYFRHSADGLFIGRTESLQTAATGPLSDDQPAGGPSTVSLYSRYTVDYGKISLYSSNDGTRALNTASPFHSSLAGATAGFSDLFTMSSASIPVFSPGTMQVRVDVTGRLQASGFASAAFQLDFFSGNFGAFLVATKYGAAPEWGANSGQYAGDSFGSYIYTVPFTFGISQNLVMVGYADASDNDPTTGGGSATADFANTFAWGGVVGVFDATGAPVLDFQLLSESGYDYTTLQPDVVPLPAAAWLFLSALVALLATRRRHL